MSSFYTYTHRSFSTETCAYLPRLTANPALFYGTGIPAAVLIFKRRKADNNALFIDASQEYQNDKNQNRLRQTDIDKIVATCQASETLDQYAYLAGFEEIKGNDFSLNIPRYVDTFEEGQEIGINAVQVEITRLETDRVAVKLEMAGYLKELGYVHNLGVSPPLL
jgi:type I restriction enzyme M protein